ncbi:nucleoside-diphosphate sugar epimerase/dehydratase [Rhizobium sp. 18065]|uniref:polysaccharide biosynthesis protein n=1 Tax=Rhizobium sp. 18065 TaxID=2681411 RepID=UPI00135C748B|nr:nucleoside-diphosphate sugar epimerase/dehydratase [Rhizobium sp. 18065]
MMPDEFIIQILRLPRWLKRCVALVVDMALCSLTVWFAFCFRLDQWVILSGVQWLTIPVSIAIAIPIFIKLGLYRAIFRYIGWAAFLSILKATSLYGLIYMTIFTTISIPGIPRTVGILQPLLLLLAVGLSRLIARYMLGDSYRRILRSENQSYVLIYGAGTMGRQLASALENGADLKVKGFLDDDQSLHGSMIGSVRVYDPKQLNALVEKLDVRTVLLAIPNISSARRNEIIESLRGAHVAVRLVPNVSELAQGRVNFSDFHELDIKDLLGREAVAPNPQLLSRNIAGKTVMVTGAGGSIGSELCRQIMAVGADRLLLVEQNEYALYAIHAELTRDYGGRADVILPLLGSVRDRRRIREILQSWPVDTIYHAAAYKHVPLVEHNPIEGIKNNVFGTEVMAKAAIEMGVPQFVLISTDKAVRPTNIMGASKRIAEMLLQALAQNCRTTTFCMVRFGNVLGSSGSVVPLFRQQIRSGGPLTLTHPEITRFFMTIPEASQLVIQAGAMAEGGDVFVLDMGEPVKIIDLARRMVELSGLTVRDDQHPDGDIAFVMTGLRPAEKLYEELLIGDNPGPTLHPLIMKARDEFLPWKTLEEKLRHLEQTMDAGDAAGSREILSSLVTGYRPSAEVVDLVVLRNAEQTEDSTELPNPDTTSYGRL